MLTRQEALTRVVEGLEKQGKRAWSNELRQCMYRTADEDGRVLKCAVGQLIPDDAPPEVLESEHAIDNMDEDIRIELIRCIGMENARENWSFLAEVQSIHDDPNSWPKIRDAYGPLARDFGLTL